MMKNSVGRIDVSDENTGLVRLFKIFRGESIKRLILFVMGLQDDDK